MFGCTYSGESVRNSQFQPRDRISDRGYRFLTVKTKYMTPHLPHTIGNLETGPVSETCSLSGYITDEVREPNNPN